jgi:hypothetical protein
VAVDNRLAAEQLAALAPGDVVAIEISGDFRKPRYSTGTVVRLEGSCIVVSWRSPRGVPYVHRYALSNGVRIGGGHHAQLVQPETAATVATDDELQQLRRIDALYRKWTRNRRDVESLRQLQAAIEECLAGRQGRLASDDATAGP